MTVAQKLRRKTKITMTTRPIVSISVNCTSSTEARIVVVRSATTPTLMSGGIAAFSLTSCCLMLSTVLMTLTPGTLKMTRKMPGLLLLQPSWVSSSGPSTATPISRTRTGAPLR